jgi:transketolase
MQRAMVETGLIVVAEDHSKAGGLGDAVLDAIAATPSGPVIKLGVDEIPGSATPKEQQEHAGISAETMKRTIIETVGQ